MSLEDRLTLLENQMHELTEVLEQIAKDADLLSVNIMRSFKPKEKQEPAAVTETTFTTLKFEPQKGAKIGDYEVAYKPNNIEDKFTQAYNVLRNSNATINNRYHGPSYEFSYWIYGEGKIYRQKLKERQQ